MEYKFPKIYENYGDLIAIGGDLSAPCLITAYYNGIFPWSKNDDGTYNWFSTNPRMVLSPDNFQYSKSLRRIVKSGKMETRIDTCFEDVIRSCASVSRKDQDSTWIGEDFIQAYIRLHEMNFAHSFETFCDGKLVGGLYGVSIGKAFFGESMFHTQSNASKVAFVRLVDFCKRHDFDFIDAQMETPLLKSFGAMLINRNVFLNMVKVAVNKDYILKKWTNL